MPNSTSSFNQSPNHSTLHRQNHPPDCSSTRRFRPPETKPPSQYRQNTPITTTIPIFGGRNRTGRVKTSPKKGAAGKYAEVMTGKAGGKFRPGRCEGRFYAEGQDFGTSRVAAGKRYERDTLFRESGEEDLCRAG